MSESELLAALEEAEQAERISEKVIISLVNLIVFYAQERQDDAKTIEYGEKARSVINELHGEDYHPYVPFINRYLMLAYTSSNQITKANELADFTEDYIKQNQEKHTVLDVERSSYEVGEYFFAKGIIENTAEGNQNALRFFAAASDYGRYEGSFNAALLSLRLNKDIPQARKYFCALLNNYFRFPNSASAEMDQTLRAKAHYYLALIHFEERDKSPAMIIRAIHNLAIAQALGSEKATEFLEDLENQRPDLAHVLSETTIVFTCGNGFIVPRDLFLSCVTANLTEEAVISELHHCLSGLPNVFDDPERIIDLNDAIFRMLQIDETTIESAPASQARATGMWDATQGASTTSSPQTDPAAAAVLGASMSDQEPALEEGRRSSSSLG